MAKLKQARVFFPKGMWLSRSTPAPSGYCSNLENFIPTTHGLELRKGCYIVDKNRKYKYIASFVSDGSIISFTDRGISRFDGNSRVITDVIVADAEDVPINYIETNGRLIFFFKNQTPKEFYYDNLSNEWKLDTLTFEAEPDKTLAFTDFTNAVRYRENVWYYKEGDNRLYYATNLKYKGELKEWDISNIFNSKGTLIFANVVGYSAGAGVQSHLACAMNSGDILIFDGNNPDNPDNWKALAQVSLGNAIYNQSVNLDTTLLCLTSQGLTDVSVAVAENSLVKAKYMAEPLREGRLDYSVMKLAKFENFLILYVNNESYDYIYNTETGGYAKISGFVINTAATLLDKFYFADVNGIFYQGFIAPYDQIISNPIDGTISKKEIQASYTTTWNDFGTNNNKKANFLTLDLYMEGGDYSVVANVATNYNSSTFSASKLPKQINRQVRWNDFTTWDTVKEKLWQGVVLNAYNNIKFTRGGLGRSVAIQIDVVGTEVAEFTLGNISIDFEVAKF